MSDDAIDGHPAPLLEMPYREFGGFVELVCVLGIRVVEQADGRQHPSHLSDGAASSAAAE